MTKNSSEKSNAAHMPGVPPSGLTLTDALTNDELSLECQMLKIDNMSLRFGRFGACNNE